MCFSNPNIQNQSSPVPLILPSTGKPMIHNEDNSYSTERTITVEMDGKHLVLPTIVDGRPYTEDEAIQLYRNGKNQPVGEFNSEDEANDYARKRTKLLGDEIKGMGR